MPRTRKETHLEKKLRELGLSSDGTTQLKSKFTYRLYFPKPPHHGVEYRAAKTKDGFNFVGLVLGHGGVTLQRIQKQTGTKIEIQDKRGNLKGAHPAANDPTLHALISADSKEKLHKAIEMVVEVLEPLNTEYEPLDVQVNGSGTLKPVITEELYVHSSSEDDFELQTGHTISGSPPSQQNRKPLSYNILNGQINGANQRKPTDGTLLSEPSLSKKTGFGVHQQENGVYLPMSSWSNTKDGQTALSRHNGFQPTKPQFVPPAMKKSSNNIWNNTGGADIAAQWPAKTGPSLPWGVPTTDTSLSLVQPPLSSSQEDWGLSPQISPDSNASSYDPLAGLQFHFGNDITHPMDAAATTVAQSSLYTYTSPGVTTTQDCLDTPDASIDHLVGLLVP